MKRLGSICLLLCLLLTLMQPVGTTFAAPSDPQPGTDYKYTWNTLDASVSVLGNKKLINNASAVILYEANSDTLMYNWNADTQVYPASMVKILTALMAIEYGRLTDMVTVDANVLSTVPYDAVSAELQEGEIISLEDLLYCMMVGSANDAAAVIAAHISGTQAAFVEEMNRYAQALGCTGSCFTNVHGLHDKEQYTTARDVAKILAKASKNEYFMKLFCATNYTVPETNKSSARKLVTSNYLISKEKEEIYLDNRVIGGRTGVTTDQKRCLAAVSECSGMRLISVVMGASSQYAADGYTVELFGGFSETSELLDHASAGYRCTQVLFNGQILRQRPVTGARNMVMLGSTSSLFAVLPNNITSADLVYQYTDAMDEFHVPIQKGEILSYVEVWYGGIRVAQAELQAMNDVISVSFEDPLSGTNQNNGWIWIVLLIVVGAVFAVLLSIAAFNRLNRGMKRAAARKRSRGYRRSRRRSR